MLAYKIQGSGLGVLSDCVGVCVCVCVRARARVCERVCVCVREREKESERASASGWTFISQNEFLKSFCKSQVTHESVNLLSMLVTVQGKLTYLCGNPLLQNDS